MSRTIDQELSPAAAHRILRSIAYWDWKELDQAAGLAYGLPVPADVPAQEEVFDGMSEEVFDDIAEEVFDGIEDHVGDDTGGSPSPKLRLWKRAGGWYLNEVPEELLAECEKELSLSDPLIDLTKATSVGDDGAADETPATGAVAAEVTKIRLFPGFVTIGQTRPCDPA